jgi:trehalose 6-phosphate phosphatase
MATRHRYIANLKHALGSIDELAQRLSGRLPAVFLDYDGTLTPIVDRPEDATISDGMRDTVRRLADRCPVCVVSGRDRRVVQRLMGVNDLIVAGTHGFDIWSPAGGAIRREEAIEFAGVLEEVRARLSQELASIEGALVEPKTGSVAAHYRLVPLEQRPRVEEIVQSVLAEHQGELKIMPGKLVYEILPNVEWDKGKAALYLLKVLDLDREDVVPIYLGDDLTDEDAFRALAGRGVGVLVGRVDDPEIAGRSTAADYVLHTIGEVQQFLDTLTGWIVPGRGVVA